MNNSTIPTGIDYSKLTARDLEECTYWILHSFNPSNLDWRLGGKGSGAADGGRDIEASFTTTHPDNDVEIVKWWIECKGRASTINPSDVKEVVLNAQARIDVDILVIVTNSTFSNNTKDWIINFQKTHPRPKVKLWDCSHLERIISSNAILMHRINSGVLSEQTKMKLAVASFQERGIYIHPVIADRLWRQSNFSEIDHIELANLTLNEAIMSQLHIRPWAQRSNPNTINTSIAHILLNTHYYASVLGFDAIEPDGPIDSALGHLLITSVIQSPPIAIHEHVLSVIKASATTPKLNDRAASYFGDIIKSEALKIAKECSEHCTRISISGPMRKAGEKFVHIDDKTDRSYFDQFIPTPIEKNNDLPLDREHLIIAHRDGTCALDIPLKNFHMCPIIDASNEDIDNIKSLEIIKTVVQASLQKRAISYSLTLPPPPP